jgi:hypothetical protein
MTYNLLQLTAYCVLLLPPLPFSTFHTPHVDHVCLPVPTVHTVGTTDILYSRYTVLYSRYTVLDSRYTGLYPLYTVPLPAPPVPDEQGELTAPGVASVVCVV